MISIDIGTHSIKFLELKPIKNQGLTIKTIDLEYIEYTGNEPTFNKIKDAFQKLVIKHNLKNKSVSISFSGCFLTYQHFENPTGIIDDLEISIHKEADNYVKINKDNRFISFNIISKHLKEEIGKVKAHDVLVAITEKTRIDEIFNLFNEHKIKILNIEPCQTSLVNLHFFNNNEPVDELSMYLDIGHETTKVIFVKNENILYAKNISKGGKYFSSVISEQLNISFEEAENLKHKHGNATEYSNDSDKIKTGEILREALHNWINDIKKTKNAFAEISGTKLKIKHIYLTGGSAQLKNINDFIESKFSCYVTQIKTFVRIKEDIDKKENINGNLFFNCLGILIRKSFKLKLTVNLLPRDLRIKRILKYRFSYVGIFLFLIVISFVVNILNNKYRDIKDNDATYTQKYRENLSYIKAISSFENNFNKKNNLSNVFIKIIDHIPENIIIDSISISRDNPIETYILNISGKKINNSTINLLKNKIEESKWFLDVIQSQDKTSSWQLKIKTTDK